jgi:hypothetical protein
MDELLVHSGEIGLQAINCCLGVCGDVPDIGIKDGVVAEGAGHYWLESVAYNLCDIVLSSIQVASHSVEFVGNIGWDMRGDCSIRLEWCRLGNLHVCLQGY